MTLTPSSTSGRSACRCAGASEGGLWEVRSSLPSRRIARVIFCLVSHEMILLHDFIKKTQKTPADDLRIAQERRKEIER